MRYYRRRDDGTIEVCPTYPTDAFTEENRRIAETLLDGYRISTVFLIIDHNHTGQGPPVLFETMIFPDGGSGDEWQRRYTTEEAAREGHAEAVNLATLGIPEQF